VEDIVALSKEEMRLLLHACKSLGRGRDYTCNDYIDNVMNMVLDFQLQSPVLGKAMEKYRTLGIKSHRKLRSIVDYYSNTQEGYSELAQVLWGYNLWSRAKFLKRILDFFEEHGIRGQASLHKWVLKADFEEDVKGKIKTEEHSIGIALYHWMRLRHGVNTVKPDVHVIRFVENAIGRKPAIQDTIDGLISVAKSLRRKPALLDAAIWQYQRDLR
jgi:hypothetical protein